MEVVARVRARTRAMTAKDMEEREMMDMGTVVVMMAATVDTEMIRGVTVMVTTLIQVVMVVTIRSMSSTEMGTIRVMRADMNMDRVWTMEDMVAMMAVGGKDMIPKVKAPTVVGNMEVTIRVKDMMEVTIPRVMMGAGGKEVTTQVRVTMEAKTPKAMTEAGGEEATTQVKATIQAKDTIQARVTIKDTVIKETTIPARIQDKIPRPNTALSTLAFPIRCLDGVGQFDC